MNKICISIGKTQHRKLPIENRSSVGLSVILRKHSFNHPSKIQNHHSSYCMLVTVCNPTQLDTKNI